MAYCGENFIKPCSATHAVKSMKINFMNLSISFKASTSNGKQWNYSIKDQAILCQLAGIGKGVGGLLVQEFIC